MTGIRYFDIVFSFLGLVLLSPILGIISVICWLETGSPILRQARMGKGKVQFNLYKFRSMYLYTPTLPTHDISGTYVTVFGRILRVSKLDELPQLINVLRGEMSLVGPRPCLPTQLALIRERDSRGIFNHSPGITGYAQILGIDMSQPEKLAEIEQVMVSELSVKIYLRSLVLTALGRGMGDRLSVKKTVV